MDESPLALLQQTLEREMPITRAMQIRAVDWTGERLSMQMPLEPNRNHQYSAFAGSLNALCTIAGWGTLFLMLQAEGLTGNIVIRRGKIRYLRPVCTPEIVATSLPAPSDQMSHFYDLLRNKGRSKLDLSVEIRDADGAFVTFTGSYVVQD